MQQILESIVIALESIWANRLRSFMTVLGNIVAVMSIVTIVSLIQGMNAMVSRVIVTDVGVDSFTIQQRQPRFTAEDEALLATFCASLALSVANFVIDCWPAALPVEKARCGSPR